MPKGLGNSKFNPAGHHVHCDFCGAAFPLTPKMIHDGPPYKFKCLNCGKNTTAWTLKTLVDELVAVFPDLTPDADSRGRIMVAGANLGDTQNMTVANIHAFIAFSCHELQGRIAKDKLDDIIAIADKGLSTNLMQALQEILLVLKGP